MAVAARTQALVAAASAIGATGFVAVEAPRDSILSRASATTATSVAASTVNRTVHARAVASACVAPFTAVAAAAIIGALQARSSWKSRQGIALSSRQERSVSVVTRPAAKAITSIGRPARGPPRGGPKGKAKAKGKPKKSFDRQEKKDKLKDEPPPELIVIPEGGCTVSEIADLLRKPVASVITYFFAKRGMPLTINDVIAVDLCTDVAANFGVEAIADDKEEITADAKKRGFLAEELDEEEAQSRAPVVTVMGHVDHGKTTLLDTIRKRSIAAGEAGGITQRIGAYTVEVNEQKVTFIDTPGHEAFTSMRARGAQVTDIAVLVVAADDGVMPQTREAIAHARAAEVPIIVAINKIDVPMAAPDKTRQALSEEGLMCEEWGGEVPMVEVSAKKNLNIDGLLEIINLTAQVGELKAKYSGPAAGVVLESTFEQNKGTLVTALVQKGTLKLGDAIVAGTEYGRVRSMQNEAGTEEDNVVPSTAVQLAGFQDPPGAGDQFEVCEDITTAKKIAAKRTKEQAKANSGFAGGADNDDVMKLAIILKTDAQGSIAAVKHMFASVKDSKYVNLRWVLAAPGPITESDIELASACPKEQRAMVIGFNAAAMPMAVQMAKFNNVELRTFNVIYELFETVVAALEDDLDAEEQLTERGRAEVLAVFGGRDGNVAGCKVLDGQLAVGNLVKVFRGGSTVVAEGPILSLRRGKEEVKDVDEDNECGFCVKGWDAWEAGDNVVCFEVATIKPSIVGQPEATKKNSKKR